MERRDTSSRRGLVTFVWAPLVATVAIGGVTAMIGRPKAHRRGVRPSDVTKGLNDPRVAKAVEAAQHALDEAKVQLASYDGRQIQQELSRRAGEAIDSTRDNVSPTLKDAGDRARELAERFRVEGQARSAELGQLIRDEVAPKAKNYAQDALGEAEDILSTARERATEFSKSARKEYGPDVSHKANALAGFLAAGSATGMHMLRERAQEMGRDTRGKGNRKLTARGKQKASSAMQAAGSQAKYVAGESMMLGFWAGMLGATIYFALLSRDQRERVKGFFSNACSQIQDVISGFQSGDEEFQSSTR